MGFPDPHSVPLAGRVLLGGELSPSLLPALYTPIFIFFKGMIALMINLASLYCNRRIDPCLKEELSNMMQNWDMAI